MFGVEAGTREQGGGMRRAGWGEGHSQVLTCPGATGLCSKMAHQGASMLPLPCAKKSPILEPHLWHQTACQGGHALFITGAALRLPAKVEIQNKRPTSEEHRCGDNKDEPQQDFWEKTTWSRGAIWQAYRSGRQFPGRFHRERGSAVGSCLCLLFWWNLAVPFDTTVRYTLTLYLFPYP